MSELLAKLMGRAYRAEDADDAGGGDDDKTADETADDDAAAAADVKAKRGDELEDEGDEGDDDDDVSGDDDDALKAKADEDEAGDDDKEGKAKGSKKPTSIPIGRFNEAQRKSREREAALSAQIAKLTKDDADTSKKDDATKLETSIAELEVQYNDQLKDGDTKEALDTMRQIRKAEREVAAVASDEKSSRAQAMAVEEIRVDFIIRDLEEKNPILNPESDDYDDDVVSLISAARKGYEADGMSSSASLDKASREVLRRMQPAAAAAADVDGETKKGLGADKVADRKTKQVKKNIDAKIAQGADMDVAGVDSDKKGGGVDGKSAMDMTDEDLEALPASTLSKLRGDFASASDA